MTALEHEPTHTTAHHELEDFLDERSMRYEVIDGAIVVNPPPTWDHQEFGSDIFAGLHAAAPPYLVPRDGQPFRLTVLARIPKVAFRVASGMTGKIPLPR